MITEVDYNDLSVGDYVEITCSNADHGRVFSIDDTCVQLCTLGENGRSDVIRIDRAYITRPIRKLGNTYADKLEMVRDTLSRIATCELVELSMGPTKYTGSICRILSDAVMLQTTAGSAVCIPLLAITQVAFCLHKGEYYEDT